jgi:replicative superfamily II helicase
MTIVFQPKRADETGSGKTFIAALLIKEKSHDEVTKPLDSGGKRTVFLVPTVVLAIQQVAYLLRTS